MIEHASFDASFRASPDAVWNYLRWENLEAMCSGSLFQGVDYEEREPVPGAIRSVLLPGGKVVRERYESEAETGLGYRYSVINLDEFPLVFYLGSVAVWPESETVTALRFACEFTPRGITADEWRQSYAGMQQVFVDFIRSELEPDHKESSNG
jgi:hypothetical protein